MKKKQRNPALMYAEALGRLVLVGVGHIAIGFFLARAGVCSVLWGLCGRLTTEGGGVHIGSIDRCMIEGQFQ